MRYTSSEPSILVLKMVVPLKGDQIAPNLQSENYAFWFPAWCQLQMLSHSLSWVSRAQAVRPNSVSINSQSRKTWQVGLSIWLAL